MNVKELKEIISELPDEMLVEVEVTTGSVGIGFTIETHCVCEDDDDIEDYISLMCDYNLDSRNKDTKLIEKFG